MAELQSELSNQQCEAINIDVNLFSDVAKDFTEGLGFDPFDLNALAEHESKENPVDSYTTEQLLKLCQLQQDMSDVLEQRFIDNMIAFKKYIPDIYEQFKDYRPKEALEFNCTSNGIPNLFFPERNEFFYKTYDPEVLCKKQVDITLKKQGFRTVVYDYQKDPLGQIYFRYFNDLVKYQQAKVTNPSNLLKTGGCPLVILLGCGLGYHIGYLYTQIEVNNLILIEPNPDLFFASLHAFDWASLLDFINSQNLCINLLIGESKENVFSDLLAFFDRHGSMLSGCMWTLNHYHSQEINELSDEITRVYHLVYSSMGFLDDLFFEVSQGYQNLLHKAHILNKQEKLPQSILDIPVCVVGNGPSLEQDLAFLRKYQDKVIIIACGSALETLFNEGIKPVFYACTERVPIVAKNLDVIKDPAYLDDIVLLATTLIYPDVTKKFKHQALFGKADEAFLWLLLHNDYDKYKNILPVGMMNPLVGNMGVAGASFLGFKQIYLFGIDNGTVEADKLHPTAAGFYNQIMTDYESKEKQSLDQIGEGNFGGQVKTKHLYKLCASVIDYCVSVFQKKNGTVYYNCSNGLKISKVPALHSQDINWDDLPNLDRKDLLDFIDHKLTQSFTLSKKEQDSFVNRADFRSIVIRIFTLLSKVETANTRQEVAFTLQEVTEMLGLLLTTNICYIFKMLAGTVNAFFIVYYRMLYLIENEQEAIEAVRVGLKYFKYLLEDALKLYEYVPSYVAVDHRAYLNGKVGFDHDDCLAPDLPELEQPSAESLENVPHKKFVKRYQ